MIESLVLQLDKYFDPFLEGPARHLKTGAEIEPSVVEGLLNSSGVGEEMYAKFVDERLKENRISIFASIKNLRIKIGMERAKSYRKPSAFSRKTGKYSEHLLVELQVQEKHTPILLQLFH